VIVEDRRWAGVLGFLGSRDIAAGRKLLDSGLSEAALAAIGSGLSGAAIAAMAAKDSNPLAAVAGALITVAASEPEVEEKWDPWLKNIAEWFMSIPDGPIVRGRRLLMRARSDEQIAEARRCFEQVFRRGVPFYSLSVDWLARGLESLPGNDEKLAQMQRIARHLSSRIDPTHAFTVIRAREGAI
jgi:hypothetical protein